jgi:ABC-type sulfate transport system permease subunit
LASAFGVVSWQNVKAEQPAEAEAVKVVSLRTKTISIPMIVTGQVVGYVVARFEISADAAKIPLTPASVESLVADEAFKLIYSRDTQAIRTAQKHDLATLTKAVAEGLNKRLGFELIKDVLIDSWSYLSKEDLAKLNEQSQR